MDTETLADPDEIERNHDWLANQPRPPGVHPPGTIESLAAIGEKLTTPPLTDTPIDRMLRKFTELLS